LSFVDAEVVNLQARCSRAAFPMQAIRTLQEIDQPIRGGALRSWIAHDSDRDHFGLVSHLSYLT
jgi:hypothetical protein